MIYELIAFPSCAMWQARVSVITNLQLQKNRYKKANDKKMSLNEFVLILPLKVCTYIYIYVLHMLLWYNKYCGLH